jgi:hypothetical protein
MNVLRSRRSGALGVAALTGLTTILVARQGARVHSLQNDEVISLNGGTWLSRHFPTGLVDWHHLSGRGFERLAAYVTALGHAIAANAADAFPLQHWLMAAVWASSGIWAYLLAREIGIDRFGALAACALTELATWRVLGTSFLNSTPAYATVPLAAWLVVRAAIRPSVARDALALSGLLLVALARTGNLLVALILPIAVVVAVLVMRDPGESRVRALRRLPRRHPLISAAALCALVAYVAIGAQDIVSGYQVHGTTWSFFWGRLKLVVAQLGEGLFILPAAVAGAWSLSRLVHGRAAAVRVFAWVTVVTFFALVYASALAGAEERYVAPVVPLLLVAFVAAVQRRQVGLVTGLIAVAVVTRAVAVQPPVFDQGPYSFFASAGQQSFTRLILERGSVDLPIGGHHVMLIASLAFMLAVVLLAVFRRGPLGRAVVIAALALPLAWSTVAGAYVTRKFVDGAGLPTVTWKQRAFVDQIAGDAYVGALEYDPQFTATMQPFWREITAFNRQVQVTVAYGFQGTLGCCGFDMRVARLWTNLDNGHVYTNGRIPRLLVWLERFAPWGLDADIVGGESYLPRPAQVLRINGHPHAAFTIKGATPTGEVRKDHTIRFRVFAPTHSAQRCLVVRIAASEGYVGKPPRRYRFTWRGGSRRGNLTTAFDTLVLPLPVIPLRGHLDVGLRVTSSEKLGPKVAVANLASTDRVDCPSSAP